MKQSYIRLTNKISKKLKEIKKEIKTKNINETLTYLINNYKLKDLDK